MTPTGETAKLNKQIKFSRIFFISLCFSWRKWQRKQAKQRALCARLSLEFVLSQREMKRECVISVRIFFKIIYDGEDYDPPDFIFYDGRERRVKLIRVCSEFEFSVNLNFIPTSFFISLLPLSPQLIVQLIRFVGFISPFREFFLHALPACLQSTEGSFKKKNNFSPSFLFI